MKLQVRYSTVVSTLALVVALTGVSAQATGVFVTSKQIKNGTIRTQDLAKGAVRSSDIGKSAVTSAGLKDGAVRSAEIRTGAVTSAAIGEGQVQPQDVTMPPPVQLQENGTASADVDTGFSLVDSVGTYTKADPDSVLEVSWTGTAAATEVNCVFQLRVDGVASANGGGMVFVGASTESTTSVSATALFGNLPAGPHRIEVWARLSHGPGTADCIVGPAIAAIPQTFVVSERVV